MTTYPWGLALADKESMRLPSMQICGIHHIRQYFTVNQRNNGLRWRKIRRQRTQRLNPDPFQPLYRNTCGNDQYLLTSMKIAVKFNGSKTGGQQCTPLSKPVGSNTESPPGTCSGWSACPANGAMTSYWTRCSW